MSAILFSLLLVFAIGLSVAIVISCMRAPKRAESGAVAALGLLIGFLTGMSESPILAGVVAGSFTIAGALIGKFWDQSSKKTETKTETKLAEKTVTITETLTEAKPTAFRLDWLLPLSGAALMGALLGAGVRINDALNLRNENVPARLRALGFNDAQVGVVMDRLAKAMDSRTLVQPNLFKAGLQSREIDATSAPAQEPDEASSFDWDQFWKDMKGDKPKYIVDLMVSNKNALTFPKAFRSVVIANRKRNKPDSEVVSHLQALTEGGP